MSGWRRPMTQARMRRIWEREGGLCGECGLAVPMRGKAVRYDHRIPGEICQADEDENVFPIHRDPCDLIKTARDQGDIARAKRRAKRHAGEHKPPTLRSRSTFQSRPFPKGGTRPIPSRPFGR